MRNKIYLINLLKWKIDYICTPKTSGRGEIGRHARLRI